MAFPLINPGYQFFDNSGNVLAGGLLYSYAPGTTTPKTTYTDENLSVPNANPIVLDSAGRCAIFLTDGEEYKFVLKDSASVTLWTRDEIKSPQALTQSGIGAIFYPTSTAETAAGITPVNFFKYYGRTDRYATNTTPGTTDVTAAVQAALDQQANGGAATGIVGNCKVTDNLNCSPSGDFEIYGIDSAVLTSTVADDATGDAILQIIGASTTRLSIRNLRLSHSGTGATLYGINVSANIASAYFENVEAMGCRYYGASVNADQQTHVNCTYSNNVHGGLEPYGGTINLIGVVCEDNGNDSDNTTGYGVVLSGTDAHIVGGKYFNNDRYNIDGRHADNLVIDGAYCYNAGYIGIYAVNEDATKDCRNIKIVNCTVDQNSRASSDIGIWVGATGASGTVTPGEILIAGNTVKNCVGEGIIVSGGSGSFPPEKVIVRDNQVTDCGAAGEHGVVVSSTTVIPMVIVEGNQVEDSNEIQINAATVAHLLNNTNKFASSRARAFYINATTVIANGNVAVGTLTGLGLEIAGATSLQYGANILGSDPDTRTGAGAISLNSRSTIIVTTGANALTLADGYESQEKYLVMKTDAGDGTLTPTNLYNGTTLTFNDVGDSAHLKFMDGQWVFMGGTATLA